jgi:toxin ParE1/3/4
MPIQWTTVAKHDLELIYSHIARNDKRAALKVIKRIYNATHTQLVVAPQSGRVGRVHNTKELVFSSIPYIIAYRASGENIQILRVLHTSLRWPGEF